MSHRHDLLRRSRRSAPRRAPELVSVLADLARLVWVRRQWWLAPVILALLLIGFLVAFEGSAIGPFLYPLF